MMFQFQLGGSNLCHKLVEKEPDGSSHHVASKLGVSTSENIQATIEAAECDHFETDQK